MAITFAVQADPTTEGWAELAPRVEASGFAALVVADHPGTTAAPFVALAAAVASTSRLRLGTSVVNAGAWHPLALASEIATLDVLSGGRTVLGIGAGHTPAEWEMTGRPLPSAAARVANMEAVIRAVQRLLAGEEVTMGGDGWALDSARLRTPRPAQAPIPLLVGGNGRATLECGARLADIVEITGLGPTLPDGHVHKPLWSPRSIDGRVQLIASATPSSKPAPELSALVQHVAVTEDRVGEAHRFRKALGTLMPADAVPPVDDLLAAPFVFMGTEAEIVEQLASHQRRWGITRYTVRTDAIGPLTPVLHTLSLGHDQT